MRSVVWALLTGLLVLPPAVGASESSRGPTPSALDSVLAGAPKYEIHSGEFRRTNIWARDFSGWSSFYVPPAHTLAGGVFVTLGATDTTRASSTDDGIQLLITTGLGDTYANFQGSLQDSTEWVLMSAAPFGSIRDDHDFWAYFKLKWFSELEDQATTVFGLWGSLSPQSNSKGSPFEHSPTDLWDGTPNTSMDCVLFRLDAGGGDAEIDLYIQRDGGGADTTHTIPLASPLEGGEEFAFHLRGRSSLDYYCAGETGTIANLDRVFGLPETTPLWWGVAQQDAGGVLNWVYVSNGWFAYAPSDRSLPPPGDAPGP
ncbi:MAG: hypothetical protein DHS20C21_01120 [Gemmatimonadota bacterium]|nr:MAG: hypothetical protein DHS20C21_01120 [Gemmatimonadota bacterium]